MVETKDLAALAGVFTGVGLDRAGVTKKIPTVMGVEGDTLAAGIGAVGFVLPTVGLEILDAENEIRKTIGGSPAMYTTGALLGMTVSYLSRKYLEPNIPESWKVGVIPTPTRITAPQRLVIPSVGDITPIGGGKLAIA